MERKRPAPGEFYRHFKNKLYQVIAIARDSETGEEMVVYQALYGRFEFWVRPLSMFMEPVDREKYPEASQQYRFERVCPQGLDGQGAGGQKANGKKANDQEGYDQEAEESGDGPQPVNPFLLDFFDAMDEKDYDRMLEYLAKMAGKITPKELDDIYMVFDLSPENGAGDRESRIRLLRNHILTLKKFDGDRLR